jgi:hypothetical protein
MLFGLDVMLRLAAGRTAAPAAAMGDSRSRPSTPASGTRAGDDGANQKHTMSPHKRDATQRLLRAWKRRHWIEYCFRTLKHLRATGACQVHNEDAYYGHLVLRLMGRLVLFYTSRVMCKGRLMMEEIIFSSKHYRRFVDCEALELKALSQGVDEKAA